MFTSRKKCKNLTTNTTTVHLEETNHQIIPQITIEKDDLERVHISIFLENRRYSLNMVFETLYWVSFTIYIIFIIIHIQTNTHTSMFVSVDQRLWG